MEKMFNISEIPKQMIYGYLQKFYVKASLNYEILNCMYNDLLKEKWNKRVMKYYDCEKNTALNIKIIAEWLFKNWNKIDWKKINAPLHNLIFDYMVEGDNDE